MYSSVKFLSPIVTGGLPTPGPVGAGAGLAWPMVAVAGVVDFGLVPELELPHAASATAAATATAAASARFRDLSLICSSWVVVISPTRPRSPARATPKRRPRCPPSGRAASAVAGRPTARGR